MTVIMLPKLSRTYQVRQCMLDTRENDDPLRTSTSTMYVNTYAVRFLGWSAMGALSNAFNADSLMQLPAPVPRHLYGDFVYRLDAVGRV